LRNGVFVRHSLAGGILAHMGEDLAQEQLCAVALRVREQSTLVAGVCIFPAKTVGRL
jgi:hypothetical protein